MHQYSQNLKDIIRHSSVEPHKPKIVLITPPPINEYQIEISDSLRGYQEKTRTAEHTKKYADACRQVGHELDVAVLDLWTAMMRRAGWKPGQDLESSKCLPENPVLKDMLRDGLSELGSRERRLIIRQGCTSILRPTRCYLRKWWKSSKIANLPLV